MRSVRYARHERDEVRLGRHRETLSRTAHFEWSGNESCHATFLLVESRVPSETHVTRMPQETYLNCGTPKKDAGLCGFPAYICESITGGHAGVGRAQELP